MSPKRPDPATRTALIEAAARLLAEEGPGALTTRRLAREIGASTMAVYTYFKGMDELRHAVRVEGFDRLAAFLKRVRPGKDPVAEVAALGTAYFANAITNPHLYRFMFMEPAHRDDAVVGIATFERLVEAVARAVDAGRFGGDPWDLALQLWAGLHGIVTLHLAGILDLEAAISCSNDVGLNLFVAFGDDRAAARRSVQNAGRRSTLQGLTPAASA